MYPHHRSVFSSPCLRWREAEARVSSPPAPPFGHHLSAAVSFLRTPHASQRRLQRPPLALFFSASTPSSPRPEPSAAVPSSPTRSHRRCPLGARRPPRRVRRCPTLGSGGGRPNPRVSSSRRHPQAHLVTTAAAREVLDALSASSWIRWYLPNILVPEGSKDIQVGQPIFITVEESDDIEKIPSDTSFGGEHKEDQSSGSAAQTVEVDAAEESPVMSRITPAAKMLIKNMILMPL